MFTYEGKIERNFTMVSQFKKSQSTFSDGDQTSRNMVNSTPATFPGAIMSQIPDIFPVQLDLQYC
jgi:hypothetical protein